MLVESDSEPLVPANVTVYFPGSVPFGIPIETFVELDWLYLTCSGFVSIVVAQALGKVAVSATVPLNLPRESTRRVAFADVPAGTERNEDEL